MVSTDPVDNRTALLDHSLGLFAEHGYDAVGVQEIVTATGVTKPTLYHYFGSKLGLLETLLHERVGPLVTTIADAARYDHDLTGTLKRVTEGYFRFATSEPAIYRLLRSLSLGPPDHPATRVAAVYISNQHAVLRETFDGAAEDHGNLRGRDTIYAATFLGAINAWISMAAAGEARLDDQAVWRTVQHFCWGIYS